ncbi:hypothetical protein WJ977_31185 [Achromobacter xylosoxidans]
MAGVAVGGDGGAAVQRRLAVRVDAAEDGFGLAQAGLGGPHARRLPQRIRHQAVELIVAPRAPPGRGVVGRVADGGGDILAGIQRGQVQGLPAGRRPSWLAHPATATSAASAAASGACRKRMRRAGRASGRYRVE